MESEEFFDMAISPEFPDEMIFELTAEDPDRTHTFSAQGINTIGDQMFHFMMARTFGFWKREGVPARKMRATLMVEFCDDKTFFEDTITEGALPYFEAGDINGLSQIDGNSRIPRERGIPLD